jgi:outer membrane lipoprotein-sorting protein
VESPGILQRHPELRWLAAAAVVAALVATAVSTLSGIFDDKTALPSTSPQQLVAKLKQPRSQGYYGTIVTRIDLGLPKAMRSALAASAPVGGSLLHGSHTLRYWYGDPERQRTAVVRADGEQDIYRNGSTVLVWDSRTGQTSRTAVNGIPLGALPMSLSMPSTLTPPELAAQILSLDSSSTTLLRSGTPIDGRPTYELVVRPKSPRSLIDSAVIDVDGAQAVPLAVRIYPRGSGNPAIDVAFTSITFGNPAARNFTFDPSARMDNTTMQAGRTIPEASPVLLDIAGSGWTAVSTYATTPHLAARAARRLGSPSRHVKGSWGSGHVACVPVLCVLATDAGRVAVGAVDADELVTAAQR